MTLEIEEEMVLLSVRDIQSGEFYYDGFASSVTEEGNVSELVFEDHGQAYVTLTFQTEDLKEERETLYGLASGRGQFNQMNRSVKCLKKSI